jgi:hypothetical protein
MKKTIIISTILLLFLTGCSQNQQIIGSHEATGEFEAQLEHDNNMLDEDIANAEQEAMDDILDDFETQLEHDSDMLEEGNEEREQELLDDILDDFETNIEEELMDDRNVIPTEEPTGGSCNMISTGSTCIDYIGNYWTESNIKEYCHGTFSSHSCEKGNIGGCVTGKGYITETIAWLYPYGGDPIADENAPLAKPVCDVNPMGEWINAR